MLNAKKFDDLYKKIEFGSQEDLEDITDKTVKLKEEAKVDGDQTDSPGNGSYTNTVNSQEFREYLKKKGLLLFPIKPERKSLTDNKEITTPTTTQRQSETLSDKKRTNVFSRLSNIFTKNKSVTPRTDRPETKPMFPSRIDARNLVNAPQARRKVYLDTKQNQNSLLVDDELKSKSLVRRTRTGRALSPDDEDYEEDTKSSISSVLSAAAEDDSVFDSPQPRRHMNDSSFQSYRRINLDKSNLYQMTNDKPPQRQQQQHAIVNGAAYAIPHVNREEPIPKPRVNYHQQLQQQHDNQVLLRNSIERRSMPVSRVTKPVRKSLTNDQQQRNTFIPITVNNVSNVSTPTSIVDPVTFAKINEIKLKTDEAFLKNVNSLVSNNNSNSSNGSRYQKMNDFITRNDLMSQQQQNMTLPRRSQSVLDDMTSAKNSIYSEVTLRRPHGNVNVIMRRTGLSTLDRKHVMDRIYEYYRKSVNNTPLSFQEHKNLKMRSQQASTSTSPPPYATFNTSLTSTPKSIFENLYAQPTRRRMSEMTDSASHNCTERIYDVVYGSNQTMSEVDYSRPKYLSTAGDIVINNKIYRPVATLQPTKVTSYNMHQKSTAPANEIRPPPTPQEGKGLNLNFFVR